MTTPTTQSVSISYSKLNEVTNGILRHLTEANHEVAYAMIGCGLAAARLLTMEKPLEDTEEVEFVEALNDWMNAYFNEGGLN